MNTIDTTPETVTADPAPFRLTEGERPPVLSGELALADVTPTLTLGGGFSPQRNGKPCFYFDKESIGPGTIRDAKGQVHVLTHKDADDIVADVSRAMGFGHEPSLPDRHFGTPGRNFGWVKGIRKNARGNIVLTHQHVGERENNDALNLKTSVMLRRNYTDERGRHWRWWLDHNALIPNPQLRDLEDFKPHLLAASSDGQPAEVDYAVLASTPEPAATPPEEPPMDWTKMRGAIGDTAKDVPDEKMMDHSVAHVEKCHGRMKKFGMALSADATEATDPAPLSLSAIRGAFTPESIAGKDDAAMLSLAAETIGSMASMQQLLDDAKRAQHAAEQAHADALTLSAAQPDVEPEMDPRLRAGLAENVADARQLALDAGMPKSMDDALKALFLSGEDDVNELALSAAGPRNQPVGRMVYRAVAASLKDVIATHNQVPRGAVPARPADAAMVLSGEATDEAANAGVDLANRYNERLAAAGNPA